MSYSSTATNSITFTVTHARHLAAKVATDLKRMQRFYGLPTDAHIASYESEITVLLRDGYLDTVTYGFKKNDDWIIPTLRYTAKQLLAGLADDDPGRVGPGASTAGASFYSFLTYSSKWHQLSPSQQEAVEKTLPWKRATAAEPQVQGGYFTDDKTYSAGGMSLGRSSIRSYT
jgi:hypothetical protein